MNYKPAFDILELSYNWDLPFTWNFPTKNFNYSVTYNCGKTLLITPFKHCGFHHLFLFLSDNLEIAFPIQIHTGFVSSTDLISTRFLFLL
ncbi:hypothetical protein LOK49_LG15G00121 [Camellia lanceoleosa]|uniref:Uncharacterized protein n=1 Tax=Camellia lanceoleosa TaxID=1840588 RepID=A0ACC0F2D9_9ERIC|nr:hypothetical protein LOK49_LG15G00121 [Camellia lanceoleosa]